MNIEERKLTMPNFSPSLKRNRLFTELDSYKDISLMLIAGDSGIGKTTLLSSYIQERDIPTIWYQLENPDGYAHIFLSYLKAGISKLMGDENPSQNVEPENVDEELEFIQSFFAKRSTPLFVVLDDFQSGDQSPEIDSILKKLIDSSSAMVTIVIISRALPKIPVSKLKVERRYKEFTTSDLAFNLEETFNFFNSMKKLKLEDHEIQLIYERTEGWVASYQLILGVIGKMNKQERFMFWSTFPDIQDIYDYLSVEVLQAQSNEIKSFLYKTSLLSNLDPLVIDELLEINNSKEILNYLARHHLFIYRDDKGVFRYHRLFRQYLYQNYKFTKGNRFVAKEHLKLAAIYERRYQLIDAFAHFTIGKDYPKAAKVMELISHRYNPVESMLFLEGWLEEISAGESLANNTIFLTRCVPLSILRELTTLFEQNIALLKKKKNELWLCNLQHRLAMIYFLRGDLVKAEQLLKESLTRSVQFHNHPISAFNLLLLGEIYRYLGKQKKAIQHVRRALFISDKFEIRHTQIQAIDVLTSIYLDEGAVDKAAPYLQQALKIASEYDESSLIFVYTTMGRMFNIKGDHSQAIEWGEQAVSLAEDYGVNFDIGWSYHELGKSYMECKQYKKTESCFIKAFEAFSLFNYFKCMVGISLFKLYMLNNDTKRAEKTNKEMLALCQTHNFYWLLDELKINDTKISINEPKRLSIRTLGKFKIFNDNQPITLKRRSSLRLLQYFITNRNKKIEKDIIIDALFPDGSLDNIENHFNVSLSVLRKALEPSLTAGAHSRFIKRFGNQYEFDTSQIHFDVEKFIELTKEEVHSNTDINISNFHQADLLYQGDFFEEYPYENFLDRERENMRSLSIKTRRILAHHYYQKEEYQKCFEYFERILDTNPHQEEIYFEYLELLLEQNLVTKSNKVAIEMNEFFEKEIGINVQGQLINLFSKFNIQFTTK